MNHPFRILLDPQGGSEGGGSSSGPDLTKVVDGLISKYGDPNAALRVLLNDNHEQRDQIRDLKGKVPSEGSVVLTGDDAKDWSQYRELGKPSDLRKSLSERDQLKDTVETFHRAEVYDTAAATSGLNPKAFRRLAEQEKLQLETKEVRGPDGKLAQVVHVKGKDEKGADTAVPISEYAEKAWPEFLSALREGQNVEPARSNGMPPRRDPPATPPRANAGEDEFEEAYRASGLVQF